jgi:hypothetical protein
MSPTTVIERLGLRRISMRQAIGDSSWASSTITWPNTQDRSWLARSARPPEAARVRQRPASSDGSMALVSGA